MGLDACGKIAYATLQAGEARRAGERRERRETNK